jgi:nitrogen fixation NifU-like protein
MYTERLIDHFKNPRNVGELASPAVTVDASNPACGDRMRLWARLEDGAVAEARFQAQGCAASVAAGSALTEWLHGKTVAELRAFRAATIEEGLGGLAAESHHAAVLCADALRALVGSVSSK